VSNKQITFEDEGHKWVYRPEKWIKQDILILTLRRMQDQESRGKFSVCRHLYGKEVDRIDNLTWDESEDYIKLWLHTTKEEPRIKEIIEQIEMRKMVKIL